MLIGSTFRFFAISFTRAKRWKLSSLYQQRTNSLSSVFSGAARPGRKKPRAWLDQASRGICVRVNQARESGSLAAMQPAQTASTILARLKLLLTAAKPVLPFLAAYSLASCTRASDQLLPPKAL